MTSDTYIYVLCDDLCEWISDSSRNKTTFSNFKKGLTDLGNHIMNECLLAIQDVDMQCYYENGRIYSFLEVSELESITHEVADKY